MSVPLSKSRVHVRQPVPGDARNKQERGLTVLFVNLMIIVFLAIAWCWNLPEDLPARRLIGPLKDFILYTGLWHGWNMFAPEPLFVNRRLSAVIHLADGSQETWDADNLSHMSLWPAFLAVRERKLIDNLLSGQMAYLKPAMSEFLAREFKARGHDVVKVELIQLRRLVPPPAEWSTAGPFERLVIWTYLAPRDPNTTASEPAARKETTGNGRPREGAGVVLNA